MTKLEDQARELGFQIRKGPNRFSGYLLKRLDAKASKRSAAEVKRASEESVDQVIDDDEPQQDQYPLGDDFRASLAEIEDYLETYAEDIAAGRVKVTDEDDAEPEVEISMKLEKVKPPSPQKLAASPRGHEHAAEIKAMAKSAKVVVRSSSPTWHDIQFEQRAQQSRQDHKHNWQRRLNPDGLAKGRTKDIRGQDQSLLRQPWSEPSLVEMAYTGPLRQLYADSMALAA